jgi:dethiobiotin synthetase
MPSAPHSSGLFITGTDTGVGKTLVSCAVIHLLRSRGMDAVGFKPVASGSSAGRWEDPEHLRASSGNCEPLEAICPIRLHAPLAPTLAARHDQRELDLNIARTALGDLRKRHATVIVEGVGGLLVPLDERTLVLDFAAEVGFPVLIVCRAALGTMNHTLLTLRELERAGLNVAGIVINTTRAEDANTVAETRGEIERIAGRKILAVLPFLGAATDAALEWAAAGKELAGQTDVCGLITKSLPPLPPLFKGERTAR